MLRLINQLLEFRKMQNNKLSLALEEVDVIAFLNDICSNFTEAASRSVWISRLSRLVRLTGCS